MRKKVLNQHGKEIAPCIVSKVRHALGVKIMKPNNVKPCSKDYWDNTCVVVGSLNNKTTAEINKAKNLFSQYI